MGTVGATLRGRPSPGGDRQRTPDPRAGHAESGKHREGPECRGSTQHPCAAALTPAPPNVAATWRGGLRRSGQVQARSLRTGVPMRSGDEHTDTHRGVTMWGPREDMAIPTPRKTLPAAAARACGVAGQQSLSLGSELRMRPAPAPRAPAPSVGTLPPLPLRLSLPCGPDAGLPGSHAPDAHGRVCLFLFCGLAVSFLSSARAVPPRSHAGFSRVSCASEPAAWRGDQTPIGGVLGGSPGAVIESRDHRGWLASSHRHSS